MNDEIREAFLDLCHEMMLAHQRENSNLTDPMLSHDDRNLIFFVSQRYNYFGCVLDEMRLGILYRGYNESHQNNLHIILEFLEEVNDSKLQGKLQGIIDALDDPSPPTKVKPVLATFSFCGQSYSAVDHWYEHLVKACKILHEKFGVDFYKAFGFKGAKGKIFFSRTSDDLRSAKLIPGTDIYVDGHGSQVGIKDTVKKLSEFFGVEPPSETAENVR